MAKRPGGAMVQGTLPTQSQLFPIFTKWGEVRHKSQLVPMIVTIVAVWFMFMYAGDRSPMIYEVGHPQRWIYTSPFILLVATYLTLLSLYFVYRLVGKQVSWFAMLGCMAFTALYIWLMSTQGAFGFIYNFFHLGLAGGEVKGDEPFFTQFYRHFVGTGFFEEFVKVLPLFAILIGYKHMSASMRATFRLEEPLDGIVLGAAAGGGFAMMETIVQYVPHALVNTWMGLALDLQNVKHPYNIPLIDPNLAAGLIRKGMILMGTSPGVQLLIPRSLDQAFGHMAYSGIFGYFIGLSVLRPERRWLILLIGLCTASLPHALWDSVGILESDIIQMSVALLSYGVLAAAVLKAREISPNRAFLQPSVVFGDMGAAPAEDGWATPAPPRDQSPAGVPIYARPAIGASETGAYRQVAPAPVALATPPPELPPGTLSLRVGERYLVVMPGLRILEHQAPGLKASTPGGPVAEVTRNPQDPTILGLTNLAQSPWIVVTTAGMRREIQTGQTLKLATGTKIDFGMIDGEVR